MHREWEAQQRVGRKCRSGVSIDQMCIINGFIGKEKSSKSVSLCSWASVGWRRGLRGNRWWIIMRSKVFQGSKQWIRRFSLDRRSIAGWRIPMDAVKHCLLKPWPRSVGSYVLLIRATHADSVQSPALLFRSLPSLFFISTQENTDLSVEGHLKLISSTLLKPFRYEIPTGLLARMLNKVIRWGVFFWHAQRASTRWPCFTSWNIYLVKTVLTTTDKLIIKDGNSSL